MEGRLAPQGLSAKMGVKLKGWIWLFISPSMVVLSQKGGLVNDQRIMA
jgi:hypothetical protein